MVDVYDILAKLCGYLQKVNLFIWERQQMIKKSISTMKAMMQGVHNDTQCSKYWPTINDYWPLLPVSEFDHGYYALRSQQPVTGESPFIKTRQELQEVLETFQIKIEERLLTEEDEILCHHTARLTNARQFEVLAASMGPEPFCLRVMEDNNLVESCRFITSINVSDFVLKEQLQQFLKCVHPFLVEPVKQGQESPRIPWKKFMVKSELYSGIPDAMQCIVTCFFMGHNESYVESIGSKLKHHNPPNRNITLEHLEEEFIVAWNGPEIPH